LPYAAAAFAFSADISWLQANSPTIASNPTTKNHLHMDFLITIPFAYVIQGNLYCRKITL
jgi:hypothetical protein